MQPCVLALLFDLEAWQPWLPDALALLDATETARVRRKYRPRDRNDLALAYALHCLVLGWALGCDPVVVALARDGSGRPFVAGEPLRTSLSHTDGCAAIAVSHFGAVGIDVEPVSRMAAMDGIALQVLHRDEVDAIASVHAARRPLALLQLWVRKEALLKAAGIGLAREMPSFVAPAGRPLPMPLDGGGDGPGKAIVHMLDVGAAWSAAIACEGHTAPTARWVNPPAEHLRPG